MANRITKRVWHIDTAGATAISTDRVVIQSIFWANNDGDILAVDDDLTITDAAGAEILNTRVEAVADTYGGGLTWTFPLGLRIKGCVVTAMDGGELYIYLA
jgi:hypothetical protein